MYKDYIIRYLAVMWETKTIIWKVGHYGLKNYCSDILLHTGIYWPEWPLSTTFCATESLHTYIDTQTTDKCHCIALMGNQLRKYNDSSHVMEISSSHKDWTIHVTGI